jgi:molybdate transport system substrate-binding protein
VHLTRRLLVACAASLACFGSPSLAAADEVRVAVAANFTEPARDIGEAFRQATGNTVVFSFGSTGALYTQIAHGAPFDVFLSADADAPARTEQEGLAAPASRFTYATGQLVLYSTRPGLVDAGGGVLKRGNFAKLAISDPKLAPYGKAAVETMQRLGVDKSLAPKLVTGSSVTQTYQFVATGAADIGFVALSQVIKVPGGSRWIVPAQLHGPIAQQAVLLKTASTNSAAIAFVKFLRSPAARTIIERYGYSVGK